MTGKPEDGLVIIVDDDNSMREALQALVQSIGLSAQTYSSVQQFLETAIPDTPCCLILDVRMPGRSGLDLQADLSREGDAPPIIFLTGHGDVPMSVRAMKAGAIEFLIKPFRDQDLIDAIHLGITRDREARQTRLAKASIRAKLATLSPREREVMDQVVQGLLNKQIAGNLGLSEITVKVHRGNVMRKMSVRSLAELVRMADLCGDGHKAA